MQEEELKRAIERAELAENKLKGIEEELQVIITALAKNPISTKSHLWDFVCQYGIMFVIIVIIIIIIIIIYRKVKVSTLKHV